MKKILNPLFVSIFALCGCSFPSNNSLNIIYNDDFISDDELEIIKSPINCDMFETYDALKHYLNNDYKKGNDDYFWILLPEMVNPIMSQNYSIIYDKVIDNKIKNPRIIESFGIYDKDLGTISNVSMDTPYYSMTYKCIFYPLNSNLIISSFKVDNISDSKIKITINSDEIIAGYVYIYFGNLNATNYVITYLKNNLNLN